MDVECSVFAGVCGLRCSVSHAQPFAHIGHICYRLDRNIALDCLFAPYLWDIVCDRQFFDSNVARRVVGEVRAIVARDNGQVFVGGDLIAVGATPIEAVAVWTGLGWSALPGLLGEVHAMTAMANGDVVVGGRFSVNGSASVRNVARWNGNSWSAMTTSIDGDVLGLAALPDGGLVAVGVFQQIDGLSVSRVARWNGGWSALGSGLDSIGRAVAVRPNGDIVVSGWFQTAGTVAARYLARWDGGQWVAMAGGLDGAPNSLAALPNGDIVAGGWFSMINGMAVANLARWDGANWSALAGGVDRQVRTVLFLPHNGALAVGGDFELAGGAVSARFAVLATDCLAAAASSGAGCAGSGNLNELVAQQLPWLGATYRAVATGLPANGVAIDVYGFGTASLPLASVLPLVGAGCDLLVTPDSLVWQSFGGGSVVVGLDIPANPVLVGQTFHHQVVPWELDGGGNLLGVTATNRLTLQIGSF